MVFAETGDREAAGAVKVWAYLDDIFLLVPRNQARRALDILFDHLRPTGYETNASKLEAWCPAGLPDSAHADPRLTNAWRTDGLLVLGGPVGQLQDGDFTERAAVPIGTPEFRARVCEAALAGARRATDTIVELPARATVTSPAVQCGLLLLRMCVNPRVIHLLRSSFSDDIINLASSFDVVVREGFERLAGFSVQAGSMSDQQMRLPIRHGGCGLASMSRIAPAAYLGSWMQCLHLVEQRVGFHVLGEGAVDSSSLACVTRAQLLLRDNPRVQQLDWRAIANEPIERGQRALMIHRNCKARTALLASLGVAERSRIQCCSGTGAGAFLSAVPTDTELALSNMDMQLALRLRLGAPLVAEHVWCSRCRARVDPSGNHAHACRGNSTIRHNRLRDLLYELLQRAGLAVLTEQEEPTLKHQPDLRVKYGLAQALTYLDESIVHATAPSANHVENAAAPDAAVRAAWRDKVAREYAPLPANMGFRLLPAVAATHGAWHPDTVAFLTECARRVGAANANLPGASSLPGAIVQGWLCRLSVALQRQNAAMMRRCVPIDGNVGLDRPWSECPPLLWELTCMSCACEDVAPEYEDPEQCD